MSVALRAVRYAQDGYHNNWRLSTNRFAEDYDGLPLADSLKRNDVKAYIGVDELTSEEIIDKSQLSETIQDLLLTLKYREREILTLRFGLGGGDCYNYEEIGKVFKISESRVKQIKDRTLRKLMKPQVTRKLEGFLNSTRSNYRYY